MDAGTRSPGPARTSARSCTTRNWPSASNTLVTVICPWPEPTFTKAYAQPSAHVDESGWASSTGAVVSPDADVSDAASLPPASAAAVGWTRGRPRAAATIRADPAVQPGRAVPAVRHRRCRRGRSTSTDLPRWAASATATPFTCSTWRTRCHGGTSARGARPATASPCRAAAASRRWASSAASSMRFSGSRCCSAGGCRGGRWPPARSPTATRSPRRARRPTDASCARPAGPSCSTGSSTRLGEHHPLSVARRGWRSRAALGGVLIARRRG